MRRLVIVASGVVAGLAVALIVAEPALARCIII